MNDMTPVLFNTRDELIKLDLDRMVYAESDGNFVKMHFLNGQSVGIAMTLQKMEELLSKSYESEAIDGRYIRIGRQYIVDRRYIVMISLTKQTLILSDLATMIPVKLAVHKEALKRLKTYLTT